MTPEVLEVIARIRAEWNHIEPAVQVLDELVERLEKLKTKKCSCCDATW